MATLFLQIDYKDMISFNNLGNMGRLGNQMFQYASLKGISANRNFDFCIPPVNFFGSRDHNVRTSEVNIYNCFENFNPKQLLTNYNAVEEKHFHFDKNLFDTCEDNTDLVGYFQSEKYFKNIKSEIKRDFSFSKELISECKIFLESLQKSEEWISLHIRRTDYIDLQDNHPLVSINYYQNCLEQLDPTIPVIIFSDDSDWCIHQEIFNSDRFFVSCNNAMYDLCLMTLCNYHIIANSSFSWWGAWLSNSKKVLAPKKWFGINYNDYILDDLYCSDWVIV
jgi:hypothetical protein